MSQPVQRVYAIGRETGNSELMCRTNCEHNEKIAAKSVTNRRALIPKDQTPRRHAVGVNAIALIDFLGAERISTGIGRISGHTAESLYGGCGISLVRIASFVVEFPGLLR